MYKECPKCGEAMSKHTDKDGNVLYICSGRYCGYTEKG